MRTLPKGSLDEPTLVQRSLAGDDLAWAQLMRHHQKAVFRMAFLVSGDPDEAEDIAQKAFLRAYRNLASFDIERPLRPWLIRITKNTAYNHLRSVRRQLAALRRRAHQLTAREAAADPTASKVQEQSDQHRLWRAVQRLSRQDQEVIYLRYFLEMGAQDTASALEVPVGTVKSRTHRALNRLRNVIQADYPDLIQGEP